MSDCSMRLKPRIDEPSNISSLSSAFSSSSTGIETFLSWPYSSVNCSRMNLASSPPAALDQLVLVHRCGLLRQNASGAALRAHGLAGAPGRRNLLHRTRPRIGARASVDVDAPHAYKDGHGGPIVNAPGAGSGTSRSRSNRKRPSRTASTATRRSVVSPIRVERALAEQAVVEPRSRARPGRRPRSCRRSGVIASSTTPSGLGGVDRVRARLAVQPRVVVDEVGAAAGQAIGGQRPEQHARVRSAAAPAARRKSSEKAPRWRSAARRRDRRRSPCAGRARAAPPRRRGAPE